MTPIRLHPITDRLGRTYKLTINGDVCGRLVRLNRRYNEQKRLTAVRNPPQWRLYSSVCKGVFRRRGDALRALRRALA